MLSRVRGLAPAIGAALVLLGAVGSYVHWPGPSEPAPVTIAERKELTEAALAAIDLVLGDEDPQEPPISVATPEAAAAEEWTSPSPASPQAHEDADAPDQLFVAEAESVEVQPVEPSPRAPASSESAGRVTDAPVLVIAGSTAPPAALDMLVSYAVVRGDTLSGLARRFGTSVEAIRELNGLGRDDLLRVGQRLRIPRVNGPVHLVQPGETLWRIARQYQVQERSIAAANELRGDRVLAGQRLFVPRGVQPEPTRVTAPESGLASQAVKQPTPTAKPTATPSPRPPAAPATAPPPRPSPNAPPTRP